MAQTKGFLSVPDQIGADLGKALGSELGKAITSLGDSLRASVLRIAVEITVDLQSRETMTKAKGGLVKKRA